ncbi:MAG: hypothetical protein DRP70_10065 [Spirochaetes bacterium]|nr:MAG: hypothetical protein DRP70_10065 [Spirochaetota bacterium]
MKSMETAENTINSSLMECDSHLRKMNLAYDKLKTSIPFTESEFPLRDENISAHLDQFLFRFIKMQDSIAKRLLPSLYQVLEDNQEPRPFLDILNRLESLDVLESVDTWQFFRNLRNNLAHDYPESREQNITNLNILFQRWQEFSAFYQGIKKYCRQRL